jgi:hypothetical protein
MDITANNETWMIGKFYAARDGGFPVRLKDPGFTGRASASACPCLRDRDTLACGAAGIPRVRDLRPLDAGF